MHIVYVSNAESRNYLSTINYQRSGKGLSSILCIRSIYILQVSKVEESGFLECIPKTSTQLMAEPGVVVELELDSAAPQACRSPIF